MPFEVIRAIHAIRGDLGLLQQHPLLNSRGGDYERDNYVWRSADGLLHVVVPLGSLWSSPLGQISAMPLQRASPLGSRASTVFCSSRALFIIRMETGLRRYLLCR